MAEWREIAAGTEGAVLSHDGCDVVGEHRQLQVDDLRSHTGARHGQAAGAEQQQGSDHLWLHGVSHARRMGAHECHLQLGGALRRDGRRGQGAETRGDPVDGGLPRHEAVDEGGGSLHRGACTGTQMCRGVMPGNRDDVVEREATASQLDGGSARRCFHLVADAAILRNVSQVSNRALRVAGQSTVAETARATDRGLSLLREVADHPHGLPLADLARAVDLSASTALRQLRSLEAAGFAVRRTDGGWVPGPELQRIARNLAASATLPRLAESVLASLAQALGESAYLAEVADERTAVYVAMESGTHAVRHVSWLGHTVPRRGTAVGRALVGNVDPDGVAVREDAVERGITAVSAPVRDASRHVVAAVSVVGPSFRLAGEVLAAARGVVAEHAAQLSRAAGFVEVSASRAPKQSA